MTPEQLEQLLNELADRIARRLHPPESAGDPPPAPSPWMNAKTAAAYLDWPVQRLYKLTAQAQIPHYKQEGRLLFHRAELDAWLAEFKQPGDWMFTGTRGISP